MSVVNLRFHHVWTRTVPNDFDLICCFRLSRRRGLPSGQPLRVDLASVQRDAEQKQSQPPDERFKWWLAVLDGELALAKHDLATAQRAFSEGEPPLKMAFRISALPMLGLYTFSNNLLLR